MTEPTSPTAPVPDAATDAPVAPAVDVVPGFDEPIPIDIPDVPVPEDPDADADPTSDTDDDVMLASVLAEPEVTDAPPGADEQEDQDADDAAVAAELPAFLPRFPRGFPGEGFPGGLPGDGAPGTGAPGDGLPGDGMPGDGTPTDGTPGDGFPGDGLPEGAVPPDGGPMPSDSPPSGGPRPTPPRTMMIAAMLALKAGFAGLCLGYTRRVFGCPGKFATAFKAWKGAELRVPVAMQAHPPAGVPAFFTPSKNGFGHVAPSLGGGMVRSTNSGTGKISNVAVDTITDHWKQPYLGYSLDLNGKLIAPLLTSDLERGDQGDAVVFLQGRLTRAGHKLKLDGVFGEKTEGAVKAFQKEHGLPQVGRMGPRTRAKINAVR